MKHTRNQTRRPVSARVARNRRAVGWYLLILLGFVVLGYATVENFLINGADLLGVVLMGAGAAGLSWELRYTDVES